MATACEVIDRIVELKAETAVATPDLVGQAWAAVRNPNSIQGKDQHK
jgi:hypothetical protein